jgi:uncharacterized phage protein (TIGR02220 family)
MFAKVYHQIFDSSIAEDHQVRHLFMDLLVLADREGVVDMTLEAIARRTNIPIDQVRRCIGELSKPDARSRSSDEGGVRIKLIDSHRDWGWQIINFAHYRELRDEESRRLYFRDYKRKQRAKAKKTKPVQSVQDIPTISTQAEAEADTEAEADPKNKESGKPDGMYHKDSRSVLHVLNEATGSHYREVDSNLSRISARLQEPEVSLDGIRLMIQRQCKLWIGTRFEKHLTPGTLFGKEKFDNYYGQREQPINDKVSGTNHRGGPDRNAGTYHDHTQYQDGMRRRLARENERLGQKVADAGAVAPGHNPHEQGG